MKSRSLILIIVILILLVAGGAAYWYFFLNSPASSTSPTITEQPSGFVPLNRPPLTPGQTTTPATPGQASSTATTGTVIKVPSLRLLSNTPVGGYGANTTATTTFVRWIDRGRGNVLEANSNSLDITTLSNTVLPRMYQSSWNKNLSAFIGSILQDGNDTPTTLYAALQVRATSTTKVAKTASTTSATSTSAAASPSASSALSFTPFELKGKNLPDNTVAYAVSPKKDKVFILTNENGQGIGYVANFNGTATTQIFTTPLTQVTADWPEDNTIVITTKGSASQGGFLYFVDPKSGIWKKIAGPLIGLSAKVSRDAKYVVLSVSGGNQNVTTNIYSIAKGTGIDAVIRTLADKCAWGNFYKDIVYCGVPFQPVSGTYPDDWYIGSISTIDKIWQINAVTGEAHLVAPLIGQADRPIDTFNLQLDDKDNYLFFMNKRDLSLWSLDLVSHN